MQSKVVKDSGFTILELITTLSLIATASLIAANNLKKLEDPVKNSTSEIIGFFKQVRARAIATTSAYRIAPSGSGKIVTEYSTNCSSEDTEVDNQLQITLPSGAALEDTSWSVCINSRGLPDSNILVTVSGESGTRTVEIYLGGAIKEISGYAS